METHKQTLYITGMTCGGCEETVRTLLLDINGVQSATVDRSKGIAVLDSEADIASDIVQAVFAHQSKYKVTFSPPSSHSAGQNIGEVQELLQSIRIAPASLPSSVSVEPSRSWFATYKPILLIFGYVSVVSVVAAIDNGVFSLMTALRIFMAGFFLVFSFFKLLDVTAFAESYAMYDIVARRVPLWGRIYPFIEVGLGCAFAFDIQPVLMNWIALIVMSVSIVGVLQQVLNKRAIRCACLGTVFQLPMSTVTIIEDGLMIVMSIIMIILHS